MAVKMERESISSVFFDTVGWVWREGHLACKHFTPASDFSLADLLSTRPNVEWYPENRPVKQKLKLLVVVVEMVVVVLSILKAISPGEPGLAGFDGQWRWWWQLEL